MMQALLGFTSEARWLRYATAHLRHLFPYLPQQPGYNKRLRNLAATINWLIGMLARDTSLWTDDVWVIDSTPVECARSRETVHRSDLAGWAEYGYCASHSRYFWGLRLHLLRHPARPAHRLRPHRRQGRRTKVLLDILHTDPTLSAAATRPDPHRRQELLRRRVRGHPGRGGPDPAPPGPQGRTRPSRQPVLQTPAPDHRIDLRHLQRPTRPRRPRRQDPHRRPSPRPATHPRPDHRDLAQRPHRPAHQTLTTGLRPLTPWNRSSRRYLVSVTRPNQHKKFQSRRDHRVSDHDRSGCANAGAMGTVLPKALRPPQDRDTRATWAPPKQ